MPKRIVEDVGVFTPSKPGEPFTWIKAKYLAKKPFGHGRPDYAGHSGKKRLRRALTPAEIALHERQPYVVMHLIDGKLHKEIRPKPAGA